MESNDTQTTQISSAGKIRTALDGGARRCAMHGKSLIACAVLGALAYGVASHPPFHQVERGEAALRINLWTGAGQTIPAGSALVIPGIHELHAFPLHDREYQAQQGADDESIQTAEGLPLRVDFKIRYAFDPERLSLARDLPENIDREVLAPAMQSVLRKTFPRYTVRDVFLERGREIRGQITAELEKRLAESGLKLKTLTFAKIALPQDYLAERVYQPKKDDGSFQSIEGLTMRVDFSVRYALDPDRLAVTVRNLPEDIDGEVVAPVVLGALHNAFPNFTVREIFSERRQEIQNRISTELEKRLAENGIALKALTLGKIGLPRDYLAGMEKMLAAELENQKMRFTLELKEKEVTESALRADAEKVRREKAAETAAQEQIIAAQAQAESMKHILPFKEKQIKQRELEAEAAKVERLKQAQAQAEARRIEAEAEADSRKKLAEAEAYRLEQIGKVNSEQMAREGAILARSPLLIQKTMAEKLSDKVQVIIAPPGAGGRFLGENLIGRIDAPQARPAMDHEQEGE
jgi:regulator of protease activity HflC (stomatin/prohibitin superfamily)